MDKINIQFKYCYGIKNLEYEFILSNRTFAIYAPNGVMKTSFAKTFDDFSKKQDTKDLAFPERETIREILADGKEIDHENIFVIEPYNVDYKSEKISTLLANKKLKQEYEDIHKEIDKSKLALTKKLKQLSGLTGRKDSLEKIVEDIFGKSFFDFIVEIERDVSSSDSLPFHVIKYSLIFNDKVMAFLQTKDFKNSIKDYIEKYDELIEKSPYLGKDFKFFHAENVQKQLVSNNFFKGGHSVNLFDGVNKNEYSTDKDLENVLEDEKRKVFSDEALQKSFDEINNKLSNKELKEFRNHLLDNQEILPELVNLEEFSKRIWFAYFVDQKELFLDLVRKYKAGQEEIKSLLEKARREKTEWEKVIRTFNTRFSHLPFHLNIKNKEDVILKDELETVEFVFHDGADEKNFQSKGDLLNILSTGEERALYILNIIFEVEARKNEGNETLFIIDDIADSFDYKNKYAIIEYLKYMSEIDKFYMMILSHNFDFFRTIQSRGVSSYNQCLIAVKNDSGIRLEPIKNLKNPFIKDWKKHLNDNKKLIASVPFVRNIIEYTRGTDNSDYLLLTSTLHYKSNTDNLTLNDVKQVFENNIQDINFPNDSLDKKIVDLIFETADDCLTADEGINLENKIALSIAIRLKAEQFMTAEITDDQFLNDLGTSQNWKLLRKYEEEYNNEQSNIEILKRVNLITPENIHVNSFMYEPILDMGDGELRSLYKKVKEELN
ncbi:MAG: hypothetical protein GY941_18410 [Planctomycetes bacterium]|nr:hypothetical protein [Planctomycetota bacterium]